MGQIVHYIRMLRVQDWIFGYFFIPIIGSIAVTGISPVLLVTAAVSFFVLAFGFVINNVADAEIDRCHAGKFRENKNPLASASLTTRESWSLAALLAAIPLVISWLCNPPAFLFVSCTLALFAAYSANPFRLKERYLIDIGTHGIMAGAFLFFIGYTLPRPDVPFLSPGPLALAALFTGIGCIALVVHQIGDYADDLGTTTTTVVRMGKSRGWILLATLVLLSLVCLAIVHLIIVLELWVLAGSLALFVIPVFLLKNEIRRDFFPAPVPPDVSPPADRR
jgi:4-hydroxybenzoate polyprenyltransferase